MTRMTLTVLLALGAMSLETGCSAVAADAERPAQRHVAAATPEAAGEYLVGAGSCDDCHTPGWAESGGTLPADQRLMGSPVGWRGEWGTSYPANLRLSVATRTEKAWIAMVRARNGRPPMPWFSLHGMSDRDLASIYAYLTKLGPKGQPVPAFVPPDQEPTTPYVNVIPVSPKAKP